MLIVGGPHKGARGILYSVSPEKYTAAVQLASPPARVIEDLEYEQVCKIDEDYDAKHGVAKEKSTSSAAAAGAPAVTVPLPAASAPESSDRKRKRWDE